MRLAVDTNVLLRALVEDGSEQTERARRRFADNPIFVPASVLLETEWVLRSHVKLDRGTVNLLLASVAQAPNAEIETRTTMLRAIDAHANGLDFADAVHLFAAQDCDALCSFDDAFQRRAKRLEGAVPVITP